MSVLNTEAIKKPFERQGIIHDLAGHPVVAETAQWRLNTATDAMVVNWDLFPLSSAAILDCAVRFIRTVIETQAPSSVYNTFSGIRFALQSASFKAADRADAVIPVEVFQELQGNDHAWRAHYVRQWYEYGVLQGYPNFSKDVLLIAERMRVGGNPKGEAVLSMDPEEGPLTDLEISGLLAALRAAGNTAALSLQQRAALWLSIAFGPNPMQMALLREEDLVVLRDEGGTTFYQLQVPRHKKGHEAVRTDFRRRPLDPELGELLLALFKENATRRAGLSDEILVGIKPVFQSPRVRTSVFGGPLHEYATHMSGSTFGRLVSDAIGALGVVSHRTGRSLSVSPRRLRYTLATRLVKEDVSKREVADLLDHSDLQNVQVYFDLKSDIVVKLDKATAMALGPIAQAFMGKVVPNAEAAVRGTDPASKVAVHDKEQAAVREVGTCGSFAFCRLAAPVACYTCSSFQPWMDGPHDILLDDLLKTRQRKQDAGMDGRMVTMMDHTIIAIADVITRIDTMREGTPT